MQVELSQEHVQLTGELLGEAVYHVSLPVIAH